METIKIGEDTIVKVDEDRIYIRQKLFKIQVIHVALFMLIDILFMTILPQKTDYGLNVLISMLLSMVIFAGFIYIFRMQEICFDLKSQELSHYHVFNNRKYKKKLLFTGNHKVSFGWMQGQISGGDDSPPIVGYELVAFINIKYHKDLFFFKKISTMEYLTEIFKEELNLEIHNRTKDTKSRLVK